MLYLLGKWIISTFAYLWIVLHAHTTYSCFHKKRRRAFLCSIPSGFHLKFMIIKKMFPCVRGSLLNLLWVCKRYSLVWPWFKHSRIHSICTIRWITHSLCNNLRNFTFLINSDRDDYGQQQQRFHSSVYYWIVQESTYLHTAVYSKYILASFW